MKIPESHTQAILNNIAKHIQLGAEEQEYFISILQAKNVRKKEFLLRQGEVAKTENFIVKGCMRVYSLDQDGTEHVLMFGLEDWWIGDMWSFLKQAPSLYFIDALENTELLQISKENLEKLYLRVPKFDRFFRIILQNAFVAQQDRIQQNLSFTAEQRYLYFVQKYPDLEQRISQIHMASYLGITPQFLSVLRRKLAQK